MALCGKGNRHCSARLQSRQGDIDICLLKIDSFWKQCS